MLTPLDSRQVTLLAGPFTAARARNLAYLRSLDPLRLLHGYYVNAGLPTRGEAYGGWEQASIAGHSLGHYLSACARLPELADRVTLILSELQHCQDARTDGFIGGMPEADRIFGELKAGIVRSTGFDLNTSWVPWYNLHKTFAGLLDITESPFPNEERVSGRGVGERLAARLADWACDVTASLDEDKWQQMLGCEHGGMNEVLAEVYARTNDPRHLALAEKFYHRAVLDPLAEGIDCLPGLHGNTQIPKILGCARLYELTGNEKYRRIAENFWRFVIDHHTYCIGGHGSGEYFGPEGKLSERLGNTTCETCNTYNMLRLTRQLFSWEPRQEYTDYIERALYNHILASQHPETGMLCYFLPLQSGRFKAYSTPEDSFWCCVGTGMENHARYEEYQGAVGDARLQLFHYTPARITLAAQGFGLTIETTLPEQGDVTLTIDAAPSTPFTLVLPQPTWSGGSAPQVLTKLWEPGEQLHLHFDKRITVEALPDNPRRIAFLDGPLVLATPLGPAPTSGAESHDTTIPTVPVLITPASPPPWEGGVNEPSATMAAAAFLAGRLSTPPSNGGGTIPYYQLHDQRYAVYLDTFTAEEWVEAEAGYRASEAQEHEKWTQVLDEFWPNQMQPERDHHYQGENAIGAELSAWKYRQAGEGGWFSFTLRALPDRALELFCKWGPPAEGEREFTVTVEGEALATPRFIPEKHRHIDQVYPIPEALTQGKEQVTVQISGPSVPLFLARLQKRL